MVGPFAGGDDDHANQIDDDKEEEALGTAPDVENPSDGQLDDATNDAGKDVGGLKLRCGLEGGIGIYVEGTGCTLLEGQHEEADPDPSIGAVDSPFRPDESGGLGLLNTKGSMGGDVVGVGLDFFLVQLLQTDSGGVRRSGLLGIAGGLLVEGRRAIVFFSSGDGICVVRLLEPIGEPHRGQ